MAGITVDVTQASLCGPIFFAAYVRLDIFLHLGVDQGMIIDKVLAWINGTEDLGTQEDYALDA